MSQCSRVLDVLREGGPKSIQEIHAKAGTMRLNSRISDLRKMGFLIAYYRRDGLHTYELLDGAVQSPETSLTDGETVGARASGPLGEVSPGPAGRELRAADEGAFLSPPECPHQLTVFEAAA